mmetsp:Transcript_13475/g.27509  ORF Transcript_13475/g.27509 Transcript_13475/m.27509 type:complete len:99 (+) Transcript_13475:205-501(+)
MMITVQEDNGASPPSLHARAREELRRLQRAEGGGLRAALTKKSSRLFFLQRRHHGGSMLHCSATVALKYESSVATMFLLQIGSRSTIVKTHTHTHHRP